MSLSCYYTVVRQKQIYHYQRKSIYSSTVSFFQKQVSKHYVLPINFFFNYQNKNFCLIICKTKTIKLFRKQLKYFILIFYALIIYLN